MATRNFIDRDVFDALIAELPRLDGEKYQDRDVIYGDMSRLVVAWLANTSPDELRAMYNQLGWGGVAGVNPIHNAAIKWMREFRPQGLREPL